MQIQERILKFVTWTNWIILFIVSVAGIVMLPPAFAKGIIFGGLIVTVNFHLLYRTLKSALTPPYISSHHAVIAKYYLRFVVSGFIIFVLIAKHIVNPLGLFIGLSVVVVSITLATILEFKNLLFKEAV
ncbi:MAG: ATP synthase subunit I [Desulfobacterales bacterium]|nr:ATP synthase subunit I [Desulfobacterales bacterium]